ncbi:putative ankyrin repeat protein [Lachnellula suecica]|uniref:Putative ankyrin repeat protein n=1 Tax=Lachnellula suecica TaxID=602035 RepID=A0A8T9CKQ8_9HELO|nr:putative ankyrin repeat protein [Lachnellula suecica]
MDPLSVTGTLIAVIQISSTVVSICYEYRQGAKNASREIVQISDELSSLRDVLEALLKLVERFEFSTSPARLATFELLVKPDGPLLTCQRELERLKKQLDPGVGWRAVRKALVWPLKEGEMKKALGALERLKSTMQLALSADQAVVSLGISDDIENLTQMFQRQTINHILQDIYKWLGAPDPYGSHFTNRKKSQVGTGTWLLNSKRYEDWIFSPKSFLWLYGIPGSGKTVLCSTVIEQLMLYCKKLPQVALVFFYFDFNNTQKRDMDALMRSLVAQLLPQCENIPGVLLDLYQSQANNTKSIDNDVLMEAFRELVRTFQDFYIVFDALDESSECEEVLWFLADIQDWSLSQIHLLVTSRQSSMIEYSFDHALPQRICLQDSPMNKDIVIYIEEKLVNDKIMAKWPPDVRNQVRRKLLAGEEGMFQWVVCQVDMLRRCLSIASVRKALETPLPKSLDETYENILSSIDETHQLEVMKTLQALTVSVDQLTLDQVVEILAVDLDSIPPRFDPDARLLDPRSILSMCSSLVTSFRPMMRTSMGMKRDSTPLGLRLAHASVADYLTQRGNIAFHFSEASARQILGQTCLVYLLNPAFSSGHSRKMFQQRIEQFPFLRHAALYWPMYLNSGEELNSKTKKLIKALFDTRFMKRGGYYAAWIGQLIPSSPEDIIQNTSPLYYAASFGLLEVVRFILESEPNLDIDALGGRASASALHVSVYRNHIEVARMLLERGADPNLPNDIDEPPMLWADTNGNKNMMQLLLEYGANASAKQRRRVLTIAQRMDLDSTS